MSMRSGFVNNEITSRQVSKLLYLFSVGSAALIVPTATVTIAKQDGWISMLLIVPVQYAIVLVYLALMRRFPRMTIAQYAEFIAGRWIGKSIALTFVFFFFILSTLVLRNMVDFMSKTVLPQTPTWFISGTFMIVILYGVFLGIETIARTGEILYIWSLFVLVIITLSLMNQVHMEFFEPVLANGLITPLKGMYPVLGFPLTECVFLTAILPMVKESEREKLNRGIFGAVAVTGAITTLIVFLLIAVMGSGETTRSPFAVYEMAKLINIEEILVRVEILFAVVWIGTVFVKLSLSVYVLSVLLGQVLGLRAYRPLVFPLCMLIAPLSLIIYRNGVHSTIFAMNVWTVYSVMQGLFVPLLLLLAALLMRKRSRKDGRFPSKEPNA
ncbi:endospore germination permease [Paenibacillus sp. PAMC21692]|uniref:GerAB/ArcD/ProY family transporter n=1 Tax=Paenibacillus sp. PAMC21692 TaxID=2762320 RepID=UPI00164CE475|nr:endospore germination permease [Paenibacillus sp. PAMC21692]QNK58303.1 endospore germination permease [Paenibacillus sp. PAMC21692]